MIGGVVCAGFAVANVAFYVSTHDSFNLAAAAICGLLAVGQFIVAKRG